MPNSQPDGQSPVLIVDETPSEAVSLERLCHALGVETMRVASAAEAGEILATIRPAAIITDLVTHDIDGCRYLNTIAEHVPTVPVMVVTATVGLLLKAASELGGNYGLSDLTCVVKPVGLPALTAFIAHSGVPVRLSSPRMY